MSPAPMVSPPDMLMSEDDAATAQCDTTVPPEVSSVAVATAEALPVAFVSLVIEFAVETPATAAPNGVADSVRVATAVPGEPTVPASRNFSFGDVPRAVVWASATVLRNAVEWVTAMMGLRIALKAC